MLNPMPTFSMYINTLWITTTILFKYDAELCSLKQSEYEQV